MQFVFQIKCEFHESTFINVLEGKHQNNIMISNDRSIDWYVRYYESLGSCSMSLGLFSMKSLWYFRRSVSEIAFP